MLCSKRSFRASPGIFATGFAAALSLILAVGACAVAEPIPGKPGHHTTIGFQNPPGSPERGSFWDRAPWLLGRVFRGNRSVEVPADHMISQMEAAATLQTLDGENTVTWIGHMTVLLRLDGVTVLTDPWFTDHATPIPPFGPKRVVPPGLALEDLPPIDVVVISHNHYDHLDLPTLDMLPNPQAITAVVPLGLGKYFVERDYGQVIELDWHETAEADGLKLTALPAIHWSKRGLFDTNRTLWAGFAIESPGGPRVYFSGDSEYGPVFGRLRDAYGGFDLAVLSIGAFKPREVMNGSHCVPADCLTIGLDLGAHTLLGVHWGTIMLGNDGFSEPAELFRNAGRAEGLPDERVWLMKIGETRAIPRRPSG